MYLSLVKLVKLSKEGNHKAVEYSKANDDTKVAVSVTKIPSESFVIFLAQLVWTILASGCGIRITYIAWSSLHKVVSIVATILAIGGENV